MRQGVLKKKERVAARRMLRNFQRKFPQLFFGIYFGSFKEIPSLRQFGFWLLNRGAFEDIKVSRPNEAGILLSVDVSGKGGWDHVWIRSAAVSRRRGDL